MWQALRSELLEVLVQHVNGLLTTRTGTKRNFFLVFKIILILETGQRRRIAKKKKSLLRPRRTSQNEYINNHKLTKAVSCVEFGERRNENWLR